MNKSYFYQNKSLFLRFHIFLLISLIYFFKFSLCETNNKVVLDLPAGASSTNKVINVITEVDSMKVNDEVVTKAKSPKAIVGEEYKVTIYFKTPLTDCSKLFMNVQKPVGIDMTDFDTSECTTFLQMFQEAYSFKTIIGRNKSLTTSANDMTKMFYNFGVTNCRYSIDFNLFDTSQVTSMEGMFYGSCFKFLNLSSFNTEKVLTMQQMFKEAKVISLDLSSFDTSQVTNIKQMFSTTSKLISLEISNFEFDSVVEVTQLFYAMSGVLKLCSNSASISKIQSQIDEAKKEIRCDDPCFTNTVNKFTDSGCVTSCLITNTQYEYDLQCMASCPDGTAEIPAGSYMCIDVLDCSKKYYSYDMSECIDEVPEGFYCNDEDKKTIEYCPENCKTCNLESVDYGLCILCNNDNFYYDAEDYITNSDPYLDCLSSAPEGYYLDVNQYKKCYETCKTCDELGDSNDHKCTACKDDLILELSSNCYEKCPSGQYYYFDDSNNYHCDSNCPTDYNIIEPKLKCTKDCRNDPPYIYLYEGKCLENCPEKYHAPNDDKVCVIALVCEEPQFYNYEYTACIDVIPEGFYCNNTLTRTIDKCPQKCKNCNLESVSNDLCTECNNILNYYKTEDDSLNNQMQCYNGHPDGYFLDVDNNIFKKCYKSCKTCDELGNHAEQLCTSCPDKYTLNGTSNCYEICTHHYYFDSNKEYFCTGDENCPAERSKLIVDKNECVESCSGEYKFEFENKCYKACPANSFYNFEQTNCIGEIPVGYYENETQKIDKCFPKCKECVFDSIKEDHCVSCNNSLLYYQKEDEALVNPYFDCYTGDQDGYFLDQANNEYKQCQKTCKRCNEKGDVRDNKCTECFSNSTMNGTNCFEICKFYHYFDDSGEYHCTSDATCPNIRNKLIVETNECVEECTGKYKFEYDDKCYTSCPPGIYYNFTQTGCIDTIPAGYYLNDSLKMTINKCDIKCENECIFDDSLNTVICKACNNPENYFKKEDGEIKNGYYDCYTGQVEKYFLDIANNEYKRCYETCQLCNELGNSLEHKCTACPNKYTQNDTNCYEICDYFYYFDLNGVYHCTDNDECPSITPNKLVERKICIKDCSDEEVYNITYKNRCYKPCSIYYYDLEGIYTCTNEEKCPEKYNLIAEKKMCIDDCKKDDIYIYMHAGICLDAPYIPKCNDSSMFIIKETGECIEDCEADDFIRNICGLRNNFPQHQDEVITMLSSSLESGTLSNSAQEMLSANSIDYLIFENSITYHLTTLHNKNILSTSLTNVSSIDLGDCENKLRAKYNIDSNLDLIILKIDYYVNYSLIPIIGYEVFNPTTFEKLNLSICESGDIVVNVPTKTLNESVLYIYDPDSFYYTDECDPTSIIDGYDIILSDRQNYFISNHLSICEKNCYLKEYNSENKQSICSCDIKSILLISSEIHNKDDLFLTEFSNSEESSSTSALKCASTLFSKDGIKKNIAFYIYLVLFIAISISGIQFYRKGFNSLMKSINQILIEKEKKTEEESPKLDNYDDFSDKINQQTLDRILKLRTPKNFRIDFKGVIRKDNINYQDNYSNNQKSINKLELYNFRHENNLETEKDIIYSDVEINSFTYKEAIGVDMRTFKQIYISFVEYYHPLIFLCYKGKDYNTIYIKLSLILIAFSLNYFLNAIFITKSMIHEIYETKNNNDIGKFIPYIFASFIISYVLDRLIRFFSLSDNNILSVSKEVLYNNAKIKAYKSRKILFYKYICFYSLGIASIIMFGYYLATFGAVYKNTQFILIKNALISYVIYLVFPFIMIALPSIFRRYALKDATRQWMFDLSRVLQHF